MTNPLSLTALGATIVAAAYALRVAVLLRQPAGWWLLVLAAVGMAAHGVAMLSGTRADSTSALAWPHPASLIVVSGALVAAMRSHSRYYHARERERAAASAMLGEQLAVHGLALTGGAGGVGGVGGVGLEGGRGGAGGIGGTGDPGGAGGAGGASESGVPGHSGKPGEPGGIGGEGGRGGEGGAGGSSRTGDA